MNKPASSNDVQKQAFLRGEGDSWYFRNRDGGALSASAERLCAALCALEVKPRRILELGCRDGRLLEALRLVWGCEACGLDPSPAAIAEGTRRYPRLRLQVGTADSLPFAADFFDLVIYGFCLYLCDRASLFAIAAEGDRVLNEAGHIAILDFFPPVAYRNSYRHQEGVFSYKMDYSSMFAWHPSYALVTHLSLSHCAPGFHAHPDERLAISILTKRGDPDLCITDPYAE